MLGFCMFFKTEFYWILVLDKLRLSECTESLKHSV